MYVSRGHCSPLSSLLDCESSYPAPSFSHWCLRLWKEWERLKVTEVVGGGVQITSRFLTSEVAGVILVFISLVLLCYKDKCNILVKHTSRSS